MSIPAFEVRVADTVEGVEFWRSHWTRWQWHPNADLDHFLLILGLRAGQILRPHVLLVLRQGEPMALVAARLEKVPLPVRLGYLGAGSHEVRAISLVYGGVMGELEDEGAVAVIEELGRGLARGDAEVVQAPNLPTGEALARALEGQVGWAWRFRSSRDAVHWEMDMPEKPGALLGGLKSKHRSWIRRKARDLEQRYPGEVRFCGLSDFRDIPHLCSEMEKVACLTYQRGLDSGFIDNEEFRRRFTMFRERGMLRAYAMMLGGRLAAYWAGTVYQKTFHSSVTGYDPALRDYELGTLLFLRMVDELAVEGVRHLDFGLGDAFYKARFGTRQWKEADYLVFRPGLRGLVWRNVLGATDQLGGWGKRMLLRLRLIDVVKRAWRQRVAAQAPAGGVDGGPPG